MTPLFFTVLLLVVLVDAQYHSAYFKLCSSSSAVTSYPVTCGVSDRIFEAYSVRSNIQCVYKCRGYTECRWASYAGGQKLCRGYSEPCDEAASPPDTRYYVIGCTADWVHYKDSCYLFSQGENLDFHTAEEYCNQQGARLVHINTEAENTFLKGQMQQHSGAENKNYWIGLSDIDVEGQWRWYGTDTAPTYTDWYPGEPDAGQGHVDEDCAAAEKSFSFQWVDVECWREEFLPVCEKTK